MSWANATSLLDELAALGVRVWRHESKVRFSPREAVPEESLLRLREHRDEVLLLLFLGEVSGRRGLGEPATATDDVLLTEPPLESGARPLRGCNACDSREFHKVTSGPEWICDRCHPSHTGLLVSETWSAPVPSLWESMRERNDRWQRFNVRGMGKRGRRPGRDADGGGLSCE